MNYGDIRKDLYKVQGYTKTKKDIILSAYKKGHYSRLYIYDNESHKLKDVVEMKHKAHVGGVTYDDKNNIVFVTGSNGTLHAYKYNSYKELDNNITVQEITQHNMATICFFEGKLYVSTFGIRSKLIEIEYKINKNKVEMVSCRKVSHLGTAVQGLAFYKNYLVTSISYGKNNKSRLITYDRDNMKVLNKRNVIHSGLEGIYSDEEGNLSGVFEFGKQEIQNFGKIELFKYAARGFTPINKSKILFGTFMFEIERKKKRKKSKNLD